MKGREKQKRTDLKKLNLKNKNAITLIALVVRIVVLLILAGVSISLILDNNGIIQKSKQARKEYGQAKENEQTDLNNASRWIDSVVNEPKVVEPENIGDWKYTEEDDGTITINRYKGSETTVIIPNYINGKKVKKIKSNSYEDRNGIYETSIWDDSICSNNKMTYWYSQTTIKKIVISEGVETIGRFAFICSSALEEVTIPNSVKNIETSAFSGPSSSITSIYYSGTAESWNKINIDSDNVNLTNANIIYNN